MRTGCLLTRTPDSPRVFITLANHDHVQSSRSPRKVAHDGDDFLVVGRRTCLFPAGTSTAAEGMYVHVSLSDDVRRYTTVAVELLHDSVVALGGLHPPNMVIKMEMA